MASTALASPALAKDDSWYIGGEFGAMLVEDADFDVNGVAGAVEGSHETGYDGGGYVGYDFGGFRLETEVSYRAGDVEQIFTNGASINTPDSDYSSLSFMLNGLVDFGPDDGLQGYVGGGIGVARTSYDVGINANNPAEGEQSGGGRCR